MEGVGNGRSLLLCCSDRSFAIPLEASVTISVNHHNPYCVIKADGNPRIESSIKESVREVLREERLLLCQVLIPYVRDEEQLDIEAEFKAPSDYDDDEVVDMTHWVKHGGWDFIGKQLNF